MMSFWASPRGSGAEGPGTCSAAPPTRRISSANFDRAHSARSPEVVLCAAQVGAGIVANVLTSLVRSVCGRSRPRASRRQSMITRRCPQQPLRGNTGVPVKVQSLGGFAWDGPTAPPVRPSVCINAQTTRSACPAGMMMVLTAPRAMRYAVGCRIDRRVRRQLTSGEECRERTARTMPMMAATPNPRSGSTASRNAA